MLRPTGLTPINVRLGPSRTWCILLVVAYGGAAFAVGLAEFPLPATVLCFLAFSALVFHDLRDQAIRCNESSVVGLRSLPESGRWHLLLGNGRQLSRGGPQVRLNHPLLVVLEFSAPRKRTRTVVIQRDAVNAAVFRRLRLQLARR